MHLKLSLCFPALLIASAALAHTGVKDPQVKARMDGMATLGEHSKTLGGMVKGTTPFDAGKARATLTAMGEEAKNIAPLFTPPATDPKSEARPAIWTEWEAFQASAANMEQTIRAAEIDTPAALNQSLRAIGAACSSCHKSYREKN